MEDRQDVTVVLPGELHDRIVDQLDYGDSKSEWIREACRMRLECEADNDVETDGGLIRQFAD